jgi:hypothetical protein
MGVDVRALGDQKSHRVEVALDRHLCSFIIF